MVGFVVGGVDGAFVVGGRVDGRLVVVDVVVVGNVVRLVVGFVVGGVDGAFVVGGRVDGRLVVVEVVVVTVVLSVVVCRSGGEGVEVLANTVVGVCVVKVVLVVVVAGVVPLLVERLVVVDVSVVVSSVVDVVVAAVAVVVSAMVVEDGVWADVCGCRVCTTENGVVDGADIVVSAVVLSVVEGVESGLGVVVGLVGVGVFVAAIVVVFVVYSAAITVVEAVVRLVLVVAMESDTAFVVAPVTDIPVESIVESATMGGGEFAEDITVVLLELLTVEAGVIAASVVYSITELVPDPVDVMAVDAECAGVVVVLNDGVVEEYGGATETPVVSVVAVSLTVTVAAIVESVVAVVVVTVVAVAESVVDV